MYSDKTYIKLKRLIVSKIEASRYHVIPLFDIYLMKYTILD